MSSFGASAALPLCLGILAARPWPAGAAEARGRLQEEAAEVGELGELRRTLEVEGIELDLAAGVLSLPATVLVKNDLLEYLLVGPGGAMHESLFVTGVRPSLLNAALLLTGVEAGRNAHWEEREGLDERGWPRRKVYPPQGDGFFLYAAWREADETYFFRVEDLVRNLESGRSLRRHRFVYLGSRFQALKPGAPEAFLADVEGNLINLSFFFQGNTLLTTAVEECIEQTIWAANEWLLPERGRALRLFFARAPLERLAPEWVAWLPDAAAAPGDAGGTDGGAER